MKTMLLVGLASVGVGVSCAASNGAHAVPVSAVSTCAPATEVLPTATRLDATKGARIVGSVATTPWHAIKSGAVVYLDDAPKRPGVGMAAAVDNHDMAFVPSITVLTAGGTVTFGNTDPLVHNVFSPDGEKWDLGSLQQNSTITKTFDKPGAYTLLCNLHQNMLGYVVVSPSSYFAKTTPDGKFAIVGVPPGTYKVTAWAPRLASSTESVTVGESGYVVANFQLHP